MAAPALVFETPRPLGVMRDVALAEGLLFAAADFNGAETLRANPEGVLTSTAYGAKQLTVSQVETRDGLRYLLLPDLRKVRELAPDGRSRDLLSDRLFTPLPTHTTATSSSAESIGRMIGRDIFTR